jgi:hypothetical protein
VSTLDPGTASNSSGATLTKTPPVSVPSGSMIAVFVMEVASSLGSGVTDSVGNIYQRTQIGSPNGLS